MKSESEQIECPYDLAIRSMHGRERCGLFSDGLDDNFSLSFFNVGIDHYFTDDFLIDFRVGVGLTEDSEDFFAGVGGGARF